MTLLPISQPASVPAVPPHAVGDLRRPSRVVIAGEAGAKLDSNVGTGGGSDDTALIQAILDRAPELGSLKLIVDGAILVRGLRVHSNTTIECLNRSCGFYLADNSNRPIVCNSLPRPEGRANHNISLLGGTYNGNAAHQEHSTSEYGWTTAIALHGVEQVVVRDISITNSRTFAVYLTNWRRIVFENIYINLDHIPTRSNQDGIHVMGPGEFLSIRNVQGRAWDDIIALNIDDLLGDWDSEGRFVRLPASVTKFGDAAGFGSVSDVEIDGVQALDCAQVVRVLSRASRLDRVSIRNVKGSYRDFGVWITPYFREGGNIGRLEFENIDLRPTGTRAYNYVPPFLFWIAGRVETLRLRNIASHETVDDRPLVWIQPDAKIELLQIQGLSVRDLRREIGRTPLIRADGRIGLLQVGDVVVQRAGAAGPAGCLIGTSADRAALKAFMDGRSWLMNPGPGRRGWPEGESYLTAKPWIARLQVRGVVADQLEWLVDHQHGSIGELTVADVTGLAPNQWLRKGPNTEVKQERFLP